jgi:hypothetical protein
MWSELTSGLMSAGTAFAPDASPPEAFRQIRSAWLGAWADFWEQFARSPQFLEMMRQSVSGSLQYRKQFNDYLADMQHQFQGVSRKDIDQLMLLVQHLEERMVDEVERLGPRLDDLGNRLDKLRRRVDELGNRVESLREG